MNGGINVLLHRPSLQARPAAKFSRWQQQQYKQQYKQVMGGNSDGRKFTEDEGYSCIYLASVTQNVLGNVELHFIRQIIEHALTPYCTGSTLVVKSRRVGCWMENNAGGMHTRRHCGSFWWPRDTEAVRREDAIAGHTATSSRKRGAM